MTRREWRKYQVKHRHERGCEPRSRLLEAVPQQDNKDLNCSIKQIYNELPASNYCWEWKQDVSRGRICTWWPGFSCLKRFPAPGLSALSTDALAAVLELELPIRSLPSPAREDA